MNSIEEFKQKTKPDEYYLKLHEELMNINKKLNAFNNITDQQKITGFPFSVKDNICVKGVETTASSKILKGYMPPFNATVIEKLDRAGLSFIGKTNMDEFGFGSFGTNTENIARNPFNEQYVAGGSSSGAAIATSVLKYHVAIAESTGGSISTPAAFCGVVGFTPTYGSVSRYGLIDYSNSLDKIGVMARKAEDILFIYNIIKGQDKYDSTCVGKDCVSDIKKKIILIEQLITGLNPEVEREFMHLVDLLEKKGYKIERRSLEFIDKAIPSYYIIAMAEASTNLARYTGFKYGYKNEDLLQNYNTFFTNARKMFGNEAKRRIVLGTFVRSASVKELYYSKALKVRSLLIKELTALLREGFILSPVMPIKTPKFDEVRKMSPLEVYKSDILTIPPNLCGFPHISFPYAYSDGMPLGAQLVTEHWNDYALLEFVKEWESSFKYNFKYNIGAL